MFSQIIEDKIDRDGLSTRAALCTCNRLMILAVSAPKSLFLGYLFYNQRKIEPWRYP